MLCCLVWTVTWASLGLQQYSAWSHGRTDPSFYSSPAPSPAGGTLGLLQVSCPSLEVGGSPTDDAFTSSISGSCCFPTLQPYLHSTAPQLWDSALPWLALTSPKMSIIHPSARPTGGTPSTGAGPRCHTLCILHIRPFALTSAMSTMKKVKASFRFFVCCFYQIPSFLPTPNLLAGTKSLSPWNVILISRFTGTDPSVTSQSSLFLLSLPCGATLLCVHVCCVQTPLQNFFPRILQCNSVDSKRYREEPFPASHTPCDIKRCGYMLLQTSSMSRRPNTIRVYFPLTS